MMEQTELAAAVRAARAAGAILRAGLRSEKHATTKAHARDPVTVFDKQSESVIAAILQEEFPDYGILSEEGLDTTGKSRCRWVIDPLDGTNNFLRGLPQFAVSIGLECSGIPVVGCVYDPSRDELFTAIRGEGAYLNGVPIQVSEKTSRADLLLAVEFSSYPPRARILHRQLARAIGEVRGVRALGAAALDLSYVAAGRVDGALFLSLSPWDVAAGCLIVAEAGGTVTDLSGARLTDPEQGLLATNGRIHATVLVLTGE